MAFTKGQSGNPGGRPKGYAEFQEKCRGYTEAALDALVSGLASEDDRIRLSAAGELLDRGWGKAPQVKTGEGGEGTAMEEVVVRWAQAHPLTPKSDTVPESNSDRSTSAPSDGA